MAFTGCLRKVMTIHVRGELHCVFDDTPEYRCLIFNCFWLRITDCVMEAGHRAKKEKTTTPALKSL